MADDGLLNFRMSTSEYFKMQKISEICCSYEAIQGRRLTDALVVAYNRWKTVKGLIRALGLGLEADQLFTIQLDEKGILVVVDGES